MKRNQLKLYEKIAATFNEKKTCMDRVQSKEKSRGRTEIRVCEIARKPKGLSPKWSGLKRIIRVQRTRIQKEKTSHSVHYYCSSLESNSASLFAQGVRGHWSIENQLHWVKDVIQNEDKAQIAKGNGIENLSILKNIAINLVRKHHSKSVKHSALYYAANLRKLWKIIRT